LEDCTPLACDRRWLLFDDIKNDLALTFLDVGRVTIRQFVGENAHTPDVHLAVVSLLPFYQLRSHPADGADATGPMLSLRSQLCRVSEVGQLDVALGISQNVVALYIAVDYVLLVQGVQAKQYLLQDVGAYILRVVSLEVGDDGSHSIFHELYENP